MIHQWSDGLRFRLAVSAILLSVAGLVFTPAMAAAESEPSTGPGVPGEEGIPQAPPAATVSLPLQIPVSLEPLSLLPVDPLDKGSLCTDLSRVNGPGGLTVREEAKLEMARAAVEASRSAGTLEGAAIHGSQELGDDADCLEEKLQQMLATPTDVPQESLPVERTEQRITDLGSVDRLAPLTPDEEAKLREALADPAGADQGGREAR